MIALLILGMIIFSIIGSVFADTDRIRTFAIALACTAVFTFVFACIGEGSQISTKLTGQLMSAGFACFILGAVLIFVDFVAASRRDHGPAPKKTRS